MDLNSHAVHGIVHPTAAFADEYPSSSGLVPHGGSSVEHDVHGDAWDSSFLNPKNRIDSLDDLRNPLWRIDGCTGLGTQFFAVPLFLKPAPPFRVDVFIPEVPAPALREFLQLNEAFHTKDRSRVSGLAVTKLVLRKLQQWTASMPDAPSWYTSLPFGSRIIFQNLSSDLDKIRIRVIPTHNLERQFKSPANLEQIWKEDGIILPPQVAMERLEIVEQLHDSVCIVRLNGGQPMIMKALTSYPRYLYVELRNLLRIAPHDNIIGRPSHVVTKRCRFGNKKAVVGFVLEYHQSGGLRDILPFRRMHNTLTLADQVAWSIQITTALIHLYEKCNMFYPDLRLENLVLSKSGHVVMVDFEQRGVWCEFSAPEVNFLEYMLVLARADDIDEAVQRRMEQRLREYFPYDYDAFETTEYDETLPNFNIPWLCLTREEQEMAEVFMLGRVLWCILEGVSAPQRSAVWQSYRWESDLEFPDYSRTPREMRNLIDRCTQGRRPTLGRKVGRVGSKLVVLREPTSAADGSSGSVAGDGERERETSTTALDEVRGLAKKWWQDEIRHAEDFLARRKELMDKGQWNSNPFGRPKLREVLRSLEEFRDGME